MESTSDSPSKTKKVVFKKPRPRQRGGKGSGAQIKPAISRPHLTLSDEIIISSKTIKIEDEHPRNMFPGLCIRSSNRWTGAKFFARARLLPYIDKLGRFTGHSPLEWVCGPSAYIATVTATISKRLFRYCLRHNPMRVVERNIERIVRCSYLYATTKNSYLWDRVLFCSRNLEKNGALMHRILLFFLCKTNDSIRFVYSQVCLQTNWLLFRAERPRDKFAFRGKCASELRKKFASTSQVQKQIHTYSVADAIEYM